MTRMEEFGMCPECDDRVTACNCEDIPSVHTWDQTFIGIAMVIAKRSKDPSTQVGAVIVGRDNRIVGIGYNGMPKGDDKAFPWTRPEKYDYVIHAEENAILNAKGNITDIEGSTLYCTHYPCVKCSRLLAQTGISKVVFIHEGRHRDEKSDHILSSMGISVTRMSIDETKVSNVDVGTMSRDDAEKRIREHTKCKDMAKSDLMQLLITLTTGIVLVICIVFLVITFARLAEKM